MSFITNLPIFEVGFFCVLKRLNIKLIPVTDEKLLSNYVTLIPYQARQLRCFHYMILRKQGVDAELVATVGFFTGMFHVVLIWKLYVLIVTRDIVVCIATGYVLDGPGIEFRWGRDFPHPSRTALEPTQRPVEWVTRLFPRSKAVRGVALATNPLLLPRSQKEESCAHAHPLGLHGPF